MRNHIQLLSAIALSSLLVTSCGDDGGATTDASTIDAPVPAGAFSLAWNLSDGSSPITCAQVAAPSLSVSLVKQGESGGMVDVFACSGGEATSRGFAPGTYNLTIDLRASGNRSLISAPVVILDIEIVDGEVVALPEQTFVVPATGGFTFMVDAQATAGNCETVDNNGAGIVNFAFALEDASGTCKVAIFDVAAGASSEATSYTSDCTTPVPLDRCLDADQLVTVNPTDSGPLKLTITGQKDVPLDGLVDCYDRVSSFSVAGAMYVTELGTLPVTLKNTLVCDPTNFGLLDAGL